MCKKQKDMENAVYAYLMVNETVNSAVLSSFAGISKKEANKILKMMESSGKLEKASSKPQKYMMKDGDFSVSNAKSLSEELREILSKKLSEIEPFVKKDGISTKDLFHSEIKETAERDGMLLRLYAITKNPSFLECAETSIETFLLPKIYEGFPMYPAMTAMFETLMLYETITGKRLDETEKIFDEIASVTEKLPDSAVDVTLYSEPFWRSSRLMRSESMIETTKRHADYILTLINYLIEDYLDNFSSSTAMAYIPILRHIRGLTHDSTVDSLIESLDDKIRDEGQQNIVDSYPSLLMKVYYPENAKNENLTMKEFDKILLRFKEEKMLDSREDALLLMDALIGPDLTRMTGDLYFSPIELISEEMLETFSLYAINLCESINGDGGWGSADLLFGSDSEKVLRFTSLGINFLAPLAFAGMEDAKPLIFDMKEAWKKAAVEVEQLDSEEAITIFKAGRYLYEHTGDAEILVSMEILMDKLKSLLPSVTPDSVIDEDEMEIFGTVHTCFRYLSLISENEKAPVDLLDFLELIDKDDEKWEDGLLISILKEDDEFTEDAACNAFFEHTYEMPVTSVSEYIRYRKSIIKHEKEDVDIKICRTGYEVGKKILRKTSLTPEDFEELGWVYWILKEA